MRLLFPTQSSEVGRAAALATVVCYPGLLLHKTGVSDRFLER
jgi:hypothetical protein